MASSHVDNPTPHRSLSDVLAADGQRLMATYPRMPVVLVRGNGTRVWDECGAEYLDFTAGLCVNVLGHCAPAVRAALEEQAGQLIHISNAFHSLPQLDLAELLLASSCFDRVFFVNSGAEANECAFKLARKWGKLRRGGAFEIITADSSFHGRTLAAVAASGHVSRDGFEPLPEGFPKVPYGDLAALAAAIGPRTAAVMLEPVLGARGVYPAERSYLEGVRRLCDECDVLLAFDEVQSGMGRTGTLWAYQGYGVEPDIMTIAKGLGGGIPIGACLARANASVFQWLDHGSTFGGNPLACRVAHRVLREVIDQELPARAARIGGRLRAALEALRARPGSGIKEIRSTGLWFGIDLMEQKALLLANALRSRGVLINLTESFACIRFSPPLTVSEDECDRFVAAFAAAMQELAT
jgi:acetylornithine/N-succinyldiaminopimelate aminotransferase